MLRYVHQSHRENFDFMKEHDKITYKGCIMLPLYKKNLSHSEKYSSINPSHMCGYLHQSSSNSRSHVPKQKRPKHETRSTVIQPYKKEHHSHQMEDSLIYQSVTHSSLKRLCLLDGQFGELQQPYKSHITYIKCQKDHKSYNIKE